MLPAGGGREAEAPTAIGNTVLASPAMPLAARPGSLGIYIIIFILFFFGETVLCFFFFFFFLVEKSEAFFYMPVSTIDILIYLL